MSRSYRKPYIKQGGNHTKIGKKMANKRVRQMLKDPECPTQFKKLSDTYDICDWKGRASDPETIIKESRK